MSTLAALTLVFAALGMPGVTAARPSPPPPASSARSIFAGDAIPNLTIVVREGGVEAPATAPTGIAAIAFRNERAALYTPLMIRLAEGATVESALAAAASGDFFGSFLDQGTLVGGPVSVPPGGSQRIVYDLRAGTHVLFGFPDDDGADEAPPVVDVTFLAAPPPVAVEPPVTASEVEMREFSFSAPPFRAGANTVKVTNAGQQLHHMIVYRLAAGVTLEQVLEAEGDPEEEGLVEAAGGLEVLSPGESAWPILSFTPGAYALICFLPDTSDGTPGAPHFALGMATEFTVE